MNEETTGNRLAGAKSSYLRSAAHQPVQWHPWSEEAFARARHLNKPVLLDIGAVWCHWCHVMDGESYENPEIARVINEKFVAIKVDRDERPDIDSRYQLAIGAISGQGGWPLTGFLTPEGEVFFGGTYFPPEDKYGRPGFKTVLSRVAELYETRGEDLVKGAKEIHSKIQEARGRNHAGEVSSEIVTTVLDSIRQSFDFVQGGFGQAPKFPHASALELALTRYCQTREEWLRVVVTKTLEAMGRGGVYDQLGGGFHRYSVDERWIVPHFEKMSYDNAELLMVYLHAYQATGNTFFREIAEGIIQYVDTVASNQTAGGFYASQDADVGMADDGDYWTWTRKEAEEVLSPPEAQVLIPYYDIYDTGEMHSHPEKNVLFIAATPEEISQKLGLPVAEVRDRIASGRDRLLSARMKRKAPFVDRTFYINWNGMMISSYLEASKVLGSASCRDFALRTIDFFLTHAYAEERGMFHAYSDGEARIKGFLDDQVHFCRALLDAFDVTMEMKYLTFAERVMASAVADFWDEKGGGFFDTDGASEAIGILAMRQKTVQDAPISSGNAVAALVLDRLFYLTGREAYREKAEQLLAAFAQEAMSYGFFASAYAMAVSFHLFPPLQVVIVGKKDDAMTRKLHLEALRAFRPGKIVLLWEGESSTPLPGALAPLLSSPPAAPTAYICAGRACAPPTTDSERLAEIISAFGIEA